MYISVRWLAKQSKTESVCVCVFGFGPLHLFLNEVLHPSWVTNGSLTKNVIIKALILRLLYRTDRRLVSRRLAMYCCYDYDSPFRPKEDLVVLKSFCLLMEIKRVFSVSFSHSLRSASIFHLTVFEAQYNERDKEKSGIFAWKVDCDRKKHWWSLCCLGLSNQSQRGHFIWMGKNIP